MSGTDAPRETNVEPHVPIPWDELKPFEQQQGGYWLYGPGTDVFGNGKKWVSVKSPQTTETFAARFRIANANLRRAQEAHDALDQEFRDWRKANPGVPAN